MQRCTIFRRLWVCLCAHACISITFVSPSTQLCLCVPFHACHCVFMYQTVRICIRVLLPFKSFFSPPGLQRGFWPAALYQQLCCTAIPRLPPQSIALYHAWHTAGLLQAQSTSSPRPAEKSRDRLEGGLRVQEDPY